MHRLPCAYDVRIYHTRDHKCLLMVMVIFESNASHVKLDEDNNITRFQTVILN